MCDNVVFMHQTDGFSKGQDVFTADIAEKTREVKAAFSLLLTDRLHELRTKKACVFMVSPTEYYICMSVYVSAQG